MRGALTLILALVLLFSGCGQPPRSQEAGSAAVAGVLGLEVRADGVTLWAAAGGENGQPPDLYRGEGRVLAEAVEDLTAGGEAVVSCAHVEHIILTPSAAGRLEELLQYAFRDLRQSAETQLWVLAGDELEEVFAGEGDLVRRMTVLKTAGKEGRGFRPVTLRRAAGGLAEGEALLLPALNTAGAGLDWMGWALWRQGELRGWLTGSAALGASLLGGETIRWTEPLRGGGSVDLVSTGCHVEALWQGEALMGLALDCRVKGRAAGGGRADGEELLRLERALTLALERALGAMQEAGGEGAGLKRRAGLGELTAWPGLAGQWEDAFPTLTAHVRVRIRMAEEN